MDINGIKQINKELLHEQGLTDVNGNRRDNKEIIRTQKNYERFSEDVIRIKIERGHEYGTEVLKDKLRAKLLSRQQQKK